MNYQILRNIQQSLPSLYWDLPLDELLVLMVERSNCLTSLAQRLGLHPQASVTLFESVFDEVVEPAGRSTVELDLDVPREYIALVAEIRRLENENGELRAQLSQTRGVADLKGACVGIIRKPRVRV